MFRDDSERARLAADLTAFESDAIAAQPPSP
jgi:hypothetical protein